MCVLRLCMVAFQQMTMGKTPEGTVEEFATIHELSEARHRCCDYVWTCVMLACMYSLVVVQYGCILDDGVGDLRL
jgi:hypothetical protein